MKLGRINVTPNDDGSFQLQCDIVKNNGQWCDAGMLNYSAKSLEEIVPVIKKAMDKVAGIKEESKRKKPSRDVEAFIKT